MHLTASFKSSHKHKNAISENSGHIPFLNNCLRFISKLKTVENTVVPCLVGWQISIKSVLAIWEDLQDNGFKYFLTKRISQDCLENLFSIIRGRTEHRDNPNPLQFWGTFRYVVVDQSFVHSQSANCTFDPDKILLDISNFSVHQKKTKNVSMPQNIQFTHFLKMATPAYSEIRKNGVSYMAGYLIKRNPIENCDQCYDLLMIEKLPEPNSVSQYELLRFKTYREINCLVYPSIVFSDFVQSIEDLFCALFGGVMYEKDLPKTLCSNAENEISHIHKCGNIHCFERLWEYVKLYITVRIHHAIKISNIGMSSGYKRNRKVLKLYHEYSKVCNMDISLNRINFGT